MQFAEPAHCIAAFDLQSVVASVPSNTPPRLLLRLLLFSFASSSNANNRHFETTGIGAAHLFINVIQP
jgi:hypothetical protein